MLDCLFYCNFEAKNDAEKRCLEMIKLNAEKNNAPIFVLKRPVIEKKSLYNYDDAFVLMTAEHKFIFINFNNDGDDAFNDYVEDFLEDVGYIAKKHDFINLLGRTRFWEDEYVCKIMFDNELDIAKCMNDNKLVDLQKIRNGEIIISLAIGSINDACRLGEGVPNNILDKIKRKIIIFDGEQTKFVFDEPKQKRITIQGLAGTGKTELLLHKIKELYTQNDSNRIVFTCHNVILADNLKKRVPSFFNFMKVEEQIEWNERLWVMRSWGSQIDPNSGLYSYICNRYGIPFMAYAYNRSFEDVCREALNYLDNFDGFSECFDYILIDESQDFPENFFRLCEKITRKCVYIAGDIFQDIFENKSFTEVTPDFLLNRCYRTDPRTLMGAHGIGMGLFEKPLRWLDDDEWKECGYSITRKENSLVELRRNPIKRFGDCDDRTKEAIKVLTTNYNKIESSIIEIIKEIKDNNPTVVPDDIGIIFLENDFQLASNLQICISEVFGWEVNIGYETKEKRKGELFLSNKNNVKGLEFPFVICLLKNELVDSFNTRNSLYMMLTRSFISSYLLVTDNGDNISKIIKGVNFVNQYEYIETIEPNDSEKKELKTAIINRTRVHKSQQQIVDEILDDLGVNDSRTRGKIHQLIKTAFRGEFDRDKLFEVIKINYSFME